MNEDRVNDDMNGAPQIPPEPSSTASGDPAFSNRERQKALFQRINPLVGLSVARYVAAISLFIGVVVFGIVSIQKLGVDLLPSITIPVVSVNTSYTGASPASVDTDVTQVVESALAQVTGVTSMSSTSSKGQSRVVLQFDDGTDINSAINQVASLVAGVTRRLPDGIDPPTVRSFNPNAQPILEFGLNGGAASQSDTYDYATNVLVPALQRVDGVANVDVSGGATREVSVLLDPNKLAAAGLTPAQVSAAIAAANVNTSLGSITQNNNTLTYTTNSALTSESDVANVVVDTTKGTRVADLGTVQASSAVNGYVRVNGLPMVLLSVQQTSGSNAVAVVNSVEKLINQTALPKGYSVTFSNDTTGPIRSAISSTEHELWVTAIVVAIVTLLFLGRLNTAITVIAAIPISLAAAPILYNLLGFTFNQVSLLALIVSIGIVVDDSIVVAENVERYRAMGYGRKEAVLRGASEVFSAVAAASLSLLAVLLPVSFLSGIIGEYVRQFALGLAAAVAMSWLEALLFLTVRMAYTPDAAQHTWRDVPASFRQVPARFLGGLRAVKATWFWVLAVVAVAGLWFAFHRAPLLLAVVLLPVLLGVISALWGVVLTLLEALTGTLSGLTARGLDFVRDGYARSLDTALRFSPLVLVASVVFLVGVLAVAVPKISFNLIPNTDSGTLRANLRLPSGLSLAAGNELIARMENYFLRQNSVQTVQANINSNGANLQITLKPIEERPAASTLTPRFQMALRRLYANEPDVRANIFSGGGFRGAGSQQTLTLVSSNFDLLTARATKAESILEADSNVASVSSSLDSTTLENRFVPNANLLAGTGLTSSGVATILQGYASGITPGNIEIGGVTYPVQVGVDPKFLTDESSLLSLPVYSSTLGAALTAGQLGSVVQGSAPATISRDNRIYSLTLTYQPQDSVTDQQALQKQLTAKLQQGGVIDNLVTVGAADRNSAFALGQQLGTLGLQAFGLSLLLVYLVMGAQFNSFRYPIYLLLPVPFAVVGALLFAAIGGGGLDVFGVLGFLLLIGLSAKNAIIYLEFVVEKMQELPFRDALLEASRLRFRPIVMTTLTVLAISFPLLLSGGSGSEYGRSLSIIIMGGVLVSAIMTFYVVPAAFYLGERNRSGRPRTETETRAEQEAQRRPSEGQPPAPRGDDLPGTPART